MGSCNDDINFLTYKIIRGDEEAFETIFYMYFPRLQRYAENILHNSQEAEDLVQDVFIQIWNNRENLDCKRKFASYIFTLVRNRCLNVTKRKVIEEKYIRQQIYSKTEELYHLSFESDDDFIPMEDRLCMELENVLQKMPERCQTAFRLKWLEGKKIREIAELMKISTTMVDKHLAKGFRIVRKYMTPEMLLLLLISIN